MNSFDFIIIDPPWQNRTVKRQKTYKILSNNPQSFNSNLLIFNIPIPSILTQNGLLCLWITNSEKIFKIALNLIKNWKLKLIAKWHWLKICKSGDPICEFNPSHKVPFETILFACKPESVENFKLIKDDFCLISIPNAYPSRKPPISILLEKLKYIKNLQNGLELFGRYLLPNFTTIGYEVIKFQNKYFFEEN
uniref:MT-A70 family protein n=1 Tax=Meloidogyne hapla TaxID=6305 RepID=A0A1I8BNX1_MELHA